MRRIWQWVNLLRYLDGDRMVYRIRALRDFGDVRRGYLGGYVENELALAHEGEAWVREIVQVYGPWSGDGDAQICDLVVIAEHAHVGGRTIVYGDEIVRGEEPLEPPRAAVSAIAAIRRVRQML